MKLPSAKNGEWSVRHGLNFFADIVRTRNLSFNENGFVRLARKAIQIYSKTDNVNFDRVVAIVPDDINQIYYLISTNGITVLTPTPLSIANVGGSPPSVPGGGDGLFFNGVLHVSTATGVSSFASPTWTSRITGLSSSYPHPMAVFEDRAQLSVANGSSVMNYDTSYTNNGSSDPWTLNIPANYVITCMRWKGGKLYIGTKHIYGGEAKMFIWDGAAASAPVGYGVQAQWIYSMADYENSIAVITSAGQLLIFTGSGFKELAHLPVFDTPYNWMSSASLATASFGNCPNRGMVAIGNRLYLNIKGDINTQDPGLAYLHKQPSGIWIYDPAIGLYHRSGHQYSKYQTLTVANLTSNVLTLSANHNLQTGDPVFTNSVPNIAGLNQYQAYYAIVTGALTMQLAFSRADALNGKNLTLTGTPSGDTVLVDSILSYGAVFDTIAGVVCPFTSIVPMSFIGAEILFTCEPITNTGAVLRCLNSFGSQANRGSFTTTPFPSAGIQDLFQKLYLLISDILYAADTIVVKYSLKKRAGMPTPARISNSGGFATWTSSTTFTTDPTKKDIKSVQVGDEVEIVSGSAAGYVTKVTAINNASTPYIFTVADVMPVAIGDVSEVIMEDWVYLWTFTSSDKNVPFNYLEVPLPEGGKGSMVQFKVEIRGYDVKIRSAELASGVDKKPI